MPKINLLNRKKRALQARKRAGVGKHNSVGVVYLVATDRNGKSYYVQKVQEDSGAIVWTDLRSNAMMFHTENGTQHFVHAYMKNRKDIHLIQTESVHR